MNHQNAQIMKNLFYVLIFSLVFFSCSKNYSNPNSDCREKSPLSAPDGATLNLITSVDYKGSFEKLQFINNQVGYLLTHSNIDGSIGLLKTKDTGKTWTEINFGLQESPEGMAFRNENLGFISVFNSKGCPNSCDDTPIVYKTINGGTTWVKTELSNIKGSLSHIQFDKSRNIYASTFTTYPNFKTAIVKSIDDGVTWKQLFASDDLIYTNINFSFILGNDIIYAAGSNGKLIKIDTSGNRIGAIETGKRNISDFRVIDEKNIVVVADGLLLKSNDSGITWQNLSSNSPKIIDFPTPDTGIIFRTNSICDLGDVHSDNDVIALTKNSGLSWNVSSEARDISTYYYQPSAKVGTRRYLFFIGLNIYELTIN